MRPFCQTNINDTIEWQISLIAALRRDYLAIIDRIFGLFPQHLVEILKSHFGHFPVDLWLHRLMGIFRKVTHDSTMREN